MRQKFATLLIFGIFLIIFLIAQLSNVKSSVYVPEISSPLVLIQASSNQTDDIRKEITSYNDHQKILNSEKFGPVTNETVLITIQVHNRISYLTHLIDSLRESGNISQALLIFSHDVYNETINKLVQNIDFCMVMQIFYPFSIQTHPFEFPGDDPNDCPRDMSRKEAAIKKCNNFEHPDAYGHYRESKFTQMKHHWWYKLNRIFDQLEVTRYHNGFLLLLEEDYYVAEDFIHVFKQLQRQIPISCPACNVISLGTYTEKLSLNTFDIMDVSPWITNRHNMAMAFNRTTWSAVKNCASFFCEYDEYNYDFSLQNVNRNCLLQKLVVLISKGPRVYHMGECGVHHSTGNCKIDEKLKVLKKNLMRAKKNKLLYPTEYDIGSMTIEQPFEFRAANGGWGDKRDQRLCLDMTKDVG